tara:strand:- start:320 stop:895 length:576 start_codon:yes stop_codon:yes gene_type:complete
MISAILLAAGKSKRMIDENKLSKKFKNTPLINHSIKNILFSNIDELIIVLGYEKELINKLIEKNNKIKIIYNKNFESGMASSIKVGLNHLSKKAESFFVCLGDMPMINKEIYNQLISQRNKKDIIVPTYNDIQGNPVLFSKLMKSSIMTIKGNFGAKKILEQNKDKILKLEINDINITKDFNTKNDFSPSS